MLQEHYVGEEGTPFLLDAKRDLTTATTTDIKVKKPDGSFVTWSGSMYGSDNNKIEYVLTAADFNVAGEYQFQSFIIDSGQEVLGNITRMRLKKPLS